MIVYGAGGLIGENENMMENGNTCKMYGETSAFWYGRHGKVIGVGTEGEKSVLCSACEFRYECTVTSLQ